MGGQARGLTHGRLWAAIDALAEANGLSPSALARRAGLSSTAFNKSKRVTADGRPRWPSTESIAKILEATGVGLGELVRFVDLDATEAPAGARAVPVLEGPPPDLPGFAETGAASALVDFPAPAEVAVFAYRVDDETSTPLYRIGDVLVAAFAPPPRRGDRVLVRTRDGQTTVHLFHARNGRTSEFASPVGRRRRLRLPSTDVLWIARILWASQ